MKLLEAFRQRNPDHRIDFTEDVLVDYGYTRDNIRSERGRRWQCYLEVDGHRVSVLYTISELRRVDPRSNSGRAIYDALVVHANRYLSPHGIELA
jgi:hypothetical protein